MSTLSFFMLSPLIISLLISSPSLILLLIFNSCCPSSQCYWLPVVSLGKGWRHLISFGPQLTIVFGGSLLFFNLSCTIRFLCFEWLVKIYFTYANKLRPPTFIVKTFPYRCYCQPTLDMPKSFQTGFSNFILYFCYLKCSRKRSYLLLLSCLVLPHIHLDILICATSILCTCCFFIGQYSTP